MLYNRALSLQRQGNNGKAEEAFRELLEHPFITEVFKYYINGKNHNYTPRNEVAEGIMFLSCPSVCPSVRPSVSQS